MRIYEIWFQIKINLLTDISRKRFCCRLAFLDHKVNKQTALEQVNSAEACQ